MKLTYNVKYFFSILILFFCFNFVLAVDLNIRQYPESPKEGEEVKLTLESDKYDLNLANIIWTVDGLNVDDGVGRKTLIFKTSSTGNPQIIIASIEQAGFEGGQIQKVVEANTNFILYEGADSYVPSFYRGRRLPGKEGAVRTAFFSFKNGEITGLKKDDSDLYTWKINDEEKKEYSGQNKIVNNLLTRVVDDSLFVKIIKQDNNGNTKSTQTNIPLQKTETIIYKTDSRNLLRQILGDTETARSIYLTAEPFFFSVGSRQDKDLTYTWKINNLESKIANPWFVVFSGKEKESVKINLDLVNNKKITQNSSRGFTFKVE